MQENINETSIDKKYMGATGANRFLLITLLCYMGSSFVLQLLANLLGGKIPFLRDTLFLLLAGQIALVVPAIVFFVKNKINVTEFLRIKRMHPITWILIIVFSYASYPIISLCNYLSLQVSENVIDGTMQDILEKYPIAICVIAVALIPCMVEETIFRGVMYQSYKRAGFFKALFMTAILFGFFHMNINQMSYAIVIGLKSDRSHVVLWAKELIGPIVFLRPLGLRLKPKYRITNGSAVSSDSLSRIVAMSFCEPRS